MPNMHCFFSSKQFSRIRGASGMSARFLRVVDFCKGHLLISLKSAKIFMLSICLQYLVALIKWFYRKVIRAFNGGKR